MKYTLHQISVINEVIDIPEGSIPFGEIKYTEITEYSSLYNNCIIHGYYEVKKNINVCCDKGKIENIPTIRMFNTVNVWVPIKE